MIRIFLYLLSTIIMPLDCMEKKEKKNNWEKQRFKLISNNNQKKDQKKNSIVLLLDPKQTIYDTCESKILYDNLYKLYKINKIDPTLLISKDPLFVYLLKDSLNVDKFNFILAITKQAIENNNSHAFIRQEYLDSFFSPYISPKAYSNPEDYKAIEPIYELLTLFGKKKLKINQSSKDDQSTILSRYISLYWKIIQNSDPIISLCIQQSDFKLINNNRNIITEVLKLAFAEHLKQKIQMETKIKYEHEINEIMRLTFSPLEEPVKQAALILNQFRIMEKNKEAPYTLNPCRYFEEASVTESPHAASPKKCFERMDETFKNNKDLAEMFK